MANNIAINNYCNLKCSYCFASDMIREENKTMSLETYIKVLKYLTEFNQEKNIGIIGGEPTLHPQFKEILIESNQCAIANNVYFTLYTNGINLEQFLPYIGDNIKILLNCNDLSDENQMLNFCATLKHCQELGWLDRKVTCGCNLYLDEYDYPWIWAIADVFHITLLRCSVTSPAGKYKDYRNHKHEYFTKMKPIFLKFCTEAAKRKITLRLDCGHIPSCYFSEEELSFIKTVVHDHRYLIDVGCKPVMDITPDLKVSPCFGTYSFSTPLDFDKKWLGLKRYFNYNCNYINTIKNTQEPCANCDKLCNFQCQGGCLAFSSPE